MTNPTRRPVLRKHLKDELEGDEESSEEENDEAALGSLVQSTNSLVSNRVLVRYRFLAQHGTSILRYPTWKLPSTFIVQIQHNKWACSQKTPLELDNRPAFLDHQLAYHGRWNMARCTIFTQFDNLQTVFELYRPDNFVWERFLEVVHEEEPTSCTNSYLCTWVVKVEMIMY